jgi:membrane associated rhomboid family serine protease
MCVSHVMVYVIIFFIDFYSLHNSDTVKDALALDTIHPTQIHRLYTYSLMHFDWLHIGLNSLTILGYGTIVEYETSHVDYLLIHVASIIHGGVSVGWETRILHNHNYVIGASAATYGLLATVLMICAMKHKTMAVRTKVTYLVMCISSITCDIIWSAVTKSTDTSYSSHIGGFIGGCLTSLWLFQHAPMKKSMYLILLY